MSEEVEQLVIEQMEEVQARHPNLELQRDPDGQLWVRGSVGFSIAHKSRTIEDRYQLGLEIPDDYPASPPFVFEREERIPKDFGHFMDAGNFCLEAPVEVRRRFAQHRNLLRFIDEQVIPYLFAYSYKRDHGSLPFGDRLHGVEGLVQYYTEFFQTSGISAMKLLKCLADSWAPPLMACPCGSGAKIQDCHGPKLDELRPHLSHAAFEAELRQMVNAARLAGIRLSEGTVLPKRMLKQERRRNKTRRTKRRKAK